MRRIEFLFLGLAVFCVYQIISLTWGGPSYSQLAKEYEKAAVIESLYSPFTYESTRLGYGNEQYQGLVDTLVSLYTDLFEWDWCSVVTVYDRGPRPADGRIEQMMVGAESRQLYINVQYCAERYQEPGQVLDMALALVHEFAHIVEEVFPSYALYYNARRCMFQEYSHEVYEDWVHARESGRGFAAHRAEKKMEFVASEFFLTDYAAYPGEDFAESFVFLTLMHDQPTALAWAHVNDVDPHVVDLASRVGTRLRQRFPGTDWLEVTLDQGFNPDFVAPSGN